MVNLQRLKIFATVADAMSFSLAAARLDVSTSHVSKQIAALEQELRSRLFHRTTRSLSLTEAGSTLHLRCRTILSSVAEAEQEILRRHDSPQGVLRITAPANFANARLSGIVCAFMKKYPAIELDMTLSDRFFDLAEESIDIALRVADEAPLNVHARTLASVEWHLVASPQYVAGHHMPQSIDELSAMDCLSDSKMSPRDLWQFAGPSGLHEITVKPLVRCGNSEWLRQCALQGMGIALLPGYLVDDDLSARRLIPLLPLYQALPSKTLYGIYLPNRYLSSKVRLFLDAVQEGLKQETTFAP